MQGGIRLSPRDDAKIIDAIADRHTLKVACISAFILKRLERNEN